MRPGLQAALADIHVGRADTLICANLSRYSRDVEHQQAMKKAVKAAGGRLLFCDMDFADTPEGDLAFGIMGNFAQYERQVIRTRTMKGRSKKVEAGQQPSRAQYPYGYRIVRHIAVLTGEYPPDMLGRYVLEPTEAPAVQYAFTAYALGIESLSSLYRQLHARGIPPRRAALWRVATLTEMFSNPVYKGQPASGRYRYETDELRVGEMGKNRRPVKTLRVLMVKDAAHWTTLSAPPIVSVEMWDTVQERLATNRSRMGGNPTRTYLLSGLVVCPKCGAKMAVTGKKTNSGSTRTYLCSQYQNALLWAGERRCERQAFEVSRIENAVMKAVICAAKEPDALVLAEQAYREPTARLSAGEDLAAIQRLDLALRELAAEEQALIAAQVAGIRAGASPEAYAVAWTDLAHRRKDLETRRAALARAVRNVPSSRKQDTDSLRTQALRDVDAVLRSSALTPEQKRRLIRMVVGKVVCQPEGAEVYFYGETLKNISVTQNSPRALR